MEYWNNALLCYSGIPFFFAQNFKQVHNIKYLDKSNHGYQFFIQNCILLYILEKRKETKL